MKTLSAILVFSLLIAANSYAGDSNDVVVKEVVGQGSNRNEAIKNALYIAVSQVRGVKVDSGNYEFGFSEAGADIDSRQAGKKKIEIDAVSVATSGTAYTTEIAGLVKTYEILEEKKIDDDTYEVKLRAMVYNYAARGDVKRIKIALMPVKTLAEKYLFSNLAVPAATVSNLFSQRLAVGLTQTNKFAVLDRENIVDFAREKQMLLSDNTPPWRNRQNWLQHSERTICSSALSLRQSLREGTDSYRRPAIPSPNIRADSYSTIGS
jgi:hypothetical protein